MKDVIRLSENIRTRMGVLHKNIKKRVTFYDRLNKAIQRQFSSVMEDDVNICVGCKLAFVGKSIGPHYKNSKDCAEAKAKVRPPRAAPLKELPPPEQRGQEVERIREPESSSSSIFNDGSESNLSMRVQDVDGFFYSEE